jgi:hypothetical protein
MPPAPPTCWLETNNPSLHQTQGGPPEPALLEICWWSGAGSNRRPHDFQMDVSPFTAVHMSVFLLVSGFSVFTPVRTTSRQFIPVAAVVAANRRMATTGELLR